MMHRWRDHRFLVDGLALTLLIVAAGLFVLRGPIRGLSRAYDLSWNYLGTKAWLIGANPYDLTSSLAMRGPGYFGSQDLQGFATPYFPAVFPITVPFAAFEWPVAVALFLTMLVVLLLALIWRVDRCLLVDQPWQIGAVMLSLFLLMYSLSTGISLTQYSIASVLCSLLVLTFDLDRRWPAVVAACLAALAMGFKPQVGIVVFVYGLVLWKMRFVVYAGTIYGVLTLIGALPIIWNFQLAWIDQVVSNIGSVAVDQQDIYCCVNLRPIIEPMMAGPLLIVVTLVPLGLFLLVVGWRALDRDRHDLWHGNPWRLTVFLLAAAMLQLSMYARPYNLVLMAPALLLYPQLKRAGLGRIIIVLYGAMAVFVQPVPIHGVLSSLVGEGYQAWSRTAQVVWRGLVVPIPTHALIVMFLSLCWIALARPDALIRSGERC